MSSRIPQPLYSEIPSQSLSKHTDKSDKSRSPTPKELEAIEPLETETAATDPAADVFMPEAQNLALPRPDTEEPESQWVRLMSQDGFSYIVKRNVAKTSGTIKNMLDGSSEGGYTEAMKGVYRLEERGVIVEKLVEYMIFKSHWQVADPREEVPIAEMLERIPPEIILELLLAADYQDM